MLYIVGFSLLVSFFVYHSHQKRVMTSTLSYYARHALDLSPVYRQQSPQAWHETLLRWLPKNAPVLELGCGRGRDARFLRDAGFSVVATDAVESFLSIARKKDPLGTYLQFALPATSRQTRALCQKAGIRHFQAIYSMALFQHFRIEELRHIARTVSDLLTPNDGVFLLCVATNYPQEKTENRFYSNYPIEAYEDIFADFGFSLLQKRVSLGGRANAQARWATLVFARKHATQETQSDLQKVLLQDHKTASYKLALLRALCDVNMTHPYQADYLTQEESQSLFIRKNRDARSPAMVAIPSLLILESFIEYYWHFLFRLGSQHYQIQKGRALGFQRELLALIAHYRWDANTSDASYWAWEKFREKYYRHQLTIEEERLFWRLLQKVHRTVKDGPVYYLGQSLRKYDDEGNQWFFMSGKGERPKDMTPQALRQYFGLLYCPAHLWQTLHHSAALLRDATILQWFQFTKDHARGANPAILHDIFSALLPTYSDRCTNLARRILRKILSHTLVSIPCVWSNQRLSDLASIDIDHIIPWSRIHNNDLWNLMPTSASINRQKSDKCVSTALLERQKDNIVRVWHWWLENDTKLFQEQACQTLLHSTWSDHAWEKDLFEALVSYNHHVSVHAHTRIWTP